jgi:hypothetical protein
VCFVAAIGAKQEPSAVVQPGGGTFDDPALTPEARAVCSLASRDHRLHAALPDQPAVLIVVVAPIGDEKEPSSQTERRQHRRRQVSHAVHSQIWSPGFHFYLNTRRRAYRFCAARLRGGSPLPN